MFGIIKSICDHRVSGSHECDGLDLSEHGVETYPEFGGVETVTGGGSVSKVRVDGGGSNDGEIKLVMAFVRPDKLGDVKKELAEVGAPSLSVTNVSGRGSQPAKKSQWRGEEYRVDLHQKVKIECVVADIPAQDVVEAIGRAAHTGNEGDGKIFVVPVENAYQIRTGKTGPEAI